MSRLLKEIAPHNAPGPRAMTTTPCLVCGDDGEGMDCCPAALCTPCLQRAAKAQGSLFRCPLCRDDGAFVIAAKRRGVVANAKATPRYASGDDLTIRRRCNAPRCKAPGGRFVDAAENPLTRHGNTEKWALATCAHCGQTSRHRGCVKRFEGFRCDDCDVQVLERTPDDFRKGDRVEARFSGGPRWYGAEVVAVVEEGIRVKYDDDGSLETIRVAARIRHRAAEEEDDARGSRRDEDDRTRTDDEGPPIGGTLRERVEPVGRTCARPSSRNSPATTPRARRGCFEARRLKGTRTKNRRRTNWPRSVLRELRRARRRRRNDGRGSMRAAGWKGSRRKRYTSGRRPTARGRHGRGARSARRRPSVYNGHRPHDHGVRCEVRRVGDARWRRPRQRRRDARARAEARQQRATHRQYHNNNCFAKGDPLPAWPRDETEQIRGAMADDDDDDAPAADESSVYNEAALRALRERVERDSGDEMTAARLDALLAGWKGSRERKLTRPAGFCLAEG